MAPQQQDTIFMRRALSLARRGVGRVSPNPAVGAILVSRGKIIGEGWHQKAGQAHAKSELWSRLRNTESHLGVRQCT